MYAAERGSALNIAIGRGCRGFRQRQAEFFGHPRQRQPRTRPAPPLKPPCCATQRARYLRHGPWQARGSAEITTSYPEKAPWNRPVPVPVPVPVPIPDGSAALGRTKSSRAERAYTVRVVRRISFPRHFGGPRTSTDCAGNRPFAPLAETVSSARHLERSNAGIAIDRRTVSGQLALVAPHRRTRQRLRPRRPHGEQSHCVPEKLGPSTAIRASATPKSSQTRMRLRPSYT